MPARPASFFAWHGVRGESLDGPEIRTTKKAARGGLFDSLFRSPNPPHAAGRASRCAASFSACFLAEALIAS